MNIMYIDHYIIQRKLYQSCADGRRNKKKRCGKR